MTCTIIKHTVDLKTGKTISREEVGQKTISDDKVYNGLSYVLTGMSLEAFAEKIREEQQKKLSEQPSSG